MLNIYICVGWYAWLYRHMWRPEVAIRMAFLNSRPHPPSTTCVLACACMCGTHTWKSEDNPQKLALSFCHMDFQGCNLGCKALTY